MLNSPIPGPHQWVTGEDCPKCETDRDENEIVVHCPVNANAIVRCGQCGHEWHVRDRFVAPTGETLFLDGTMASQLPEQALVQN